MSLAPRPRADPLSCSEMSAAIFAGQAGYG
jgi:hypothetical protein